MTAELVAAAAALAALWAARRRGWLTAAGRVAAVAVGAGVWGGVGPAGLLLLLVFFATSVALGRVRGPSAARRGDATPRRAGQVLANGGVAAALGVAHAAGALPAPAAAAGIVGALSAATADTWASEVGRAAGGLTWIPLGRERVSPGTTGGVSAAGSLAALLGAGLLAGTAALLRPAGVGGWFGPGLAAGVAGAVLDSLLGDLLERRLGWLGNDAVNAAATATGAAVAMWLVRF